ncbi:bifunctional methylenetetrahydrofolate dehydrogenase/methenyltetrahydrofolate cyclohydrolase [Gryllotalpicola ginsengisoli]|uniref:bifunctional methylenetetrahydrofolate dehydrogenase/methenyltetrahydrofolate cyclohydrolase n=1 Tax=Gryllotalpicola ginsengisoli TaxID=444608 RepID=UPI0003B59F20|nr:bifunctional methylenetetrahydrofolate dehydrogenase/methenyltetrahydrofolate cyclohydrolase [Gryllotalpicola ginsengisoli]
MTAEVLDPSPIAAQYREEVRREVERLTDAAGRRPRIRGLLAQEEGPAATYARYARRGCEAVGIDLDVRHVDAEQVEAAVAEANVDPEVDGVFLYYPLTDRAGDRWLRELVDPRKDVEGLHSFWSRLLYENQRFVDAEHRMRAILPCTPLAILKLLQHAGMEGTNVNAPLEGVTACVINRSDLVGLPLAAMLANDGARVHSLDLSGSVTFEPAIGRRTHDVRDSGIDRVAALAAADVVISAVPSKDFELVRGDEIREGAICVDVAEYSNFDASVMERARAFVPRVGPLTIAMAMRNLTRLAAMRAR